MKINQIIKEMPLRSGGSCSRCDEDYTSFTGKKLLVEFCGKNGFLAEPINVCYPCYQEIKNE